MDKEWGAEPNVSMCSITKSSFEAGIRWHINALWHDKSELPKVSKPIFIECKYIGAPSCYYVIDSWYFKRYPVNRWVYIEDLLPD